MNPWKLNGRAQSLTLRAIVKGLNISFVDIYKTVKEVKSDGTIITKDGKEYELVLKEK
jgi:hypothetical protein